MSGAAIFCTVVVFACSSTSDHAADSEDGAVCVIFQRDTRKIKAPSAGNNFLVNVPAMPTRGPPISITLQYEIRAQASRECDLRFGILR